MLIAMWSGIGRKDHWLSRYANAAVIILQVPAHKFGIPRPHTVRNNEILESSEEADVHFSCSLIHQYLRDYTTVQLRRHTIRD